MLKYKAKANLSSNLKPIQISEMYVSPDLTFISGITPYNSSLTNGDTVFISSPWASKPIMSTVSLQKVQRQGYISVTKNVHLQHVNVDDNTQIRFIEWNGVYYYEFQKYPFDGFFIDNHYYPLNYDNTVTLPVKYYIEDGHVTINSVEYTADMNLMKDSEISDGYLAPQIIDESTGYHLSSIDGKDFQISDYEYDKWSSVYKFVIQIGDIQDLRISKSQIAEYSFFIEYNGNSYDFQIFSGDSHDIEYGIEIEGTKYGVSGVTSAGELALYSDTPTIEINGQTVPVNKVLRQSNLGHYIILFTNYEGLSLKTNDVIVAESIYSSYTVNVQAIAKYDASGNPTSESAMVVDINDERYYVQDNLISYVEIKNQEYEITFLDDGNKNGYITINGENIPVIVNNDKCRLKNKIYIDSSNGITYNVDIKEWDVKKRSGITLTDGTVCPIFSGVMDDSITCVIPKRQKYRLSIVDSMGSDGLLCAPIVADLDGEEAFFNSSEATLDIQNNLSSFRFYVEGNRLGIHPFNLFYGAIRSTNTDMPLSSLNLGNDVSKIAVYKASNSLVLPLILSNDVNPNINKENALETSLKDRINASHIVDMEKDIYYPAYISTDDKGNKIFNPITSLEFNLHFRTRDLDTWKVNKDNTQEMGVFSVNKISTIIDSDGMPKITTGDSQEEHSVLSQSLSNSANWFITDYYEYKKLLASTITDNSETVQTKKLQSLPDLLGFLGFENDDIMYRKNVLSKSFLRLSFYSTPDPNNQMLLATSTIFLDANLYYKKYMNLVTNGDHHYKKMTLGRQDKKFTKVDNLSEHYVGQKIATTGRVFGHLDERRDISGETMTFDDDLRLGSKITVYDKYESSVSSEGFYLYLFKEYSTGLREGTIYMKVDFCHAGTGIIIPFIIPTGYDDDGNRYVLYLDKFEDVEQMKRGISLKNAYESLYIPIRVKYSQKDNNFFYYLPDEFVENGYLGEDNSKMIFNLFEVKLKNESYYENNY